MVVASTALLCVVIFKGAGGVVNLVKDLEATVTAVLQLMVNPMNRTCSFIHIM